MSKRMPQPPPFVVNLPRESRNMRYQVYASSGSDSPHGKAGHYQATYVFTTPGRQTHLEHVNLDQLLASGDTLLIFPSPVYLRVSCYADEQIIPIYLIPNEHERLARAEMRLFAQSLPGARRVTYNLVSYITSTLSYHFDIALDILGFQVREEETGVHYWSVNVLSHPKTLDPIPLIPAQTECKPMLAAYREAMNTTNPFYKVLCLYRTIEGIRNLRQQKRRKAKANDAEYRDPSERIPNSVEELPEEYRRAGKQFLPFLGKKFNYVIDKGLRDDFRHAIAHIDPTRDTLVFDDYEHIERAEQIIPVITYVSRTMLEAELADELEGLQGS